MLGRIALVISDPRIQERLETVAREMGAEPVVFNAPGYLDLPELPTAIVVEIEFEDAIISIGAWKKRWPATLIVGSATLPDQERWHAAVAAGCGLVVNRGALPRQLKKRLEEIRAGGAGVGGARRLLVRLNDLPGDGLVGNLPDAPDGPIVVYRLGRTFYAIRDVCPHAGASLADGTLERTILTCPRHGSQFDIATGERMRGPSDFPIRTYRVVLDGDQVFVEL